MISDEYLKTLVTTLADVWRTTEAHKLSRIPALRLIQEIRDMFQLDRLRCRRVLCLYDAPTVVCAACNVKRRTAMNIMALVKMYLQTLKDRQHLISKFESLSMSLQYKIATAISPDNIDYWVAVAGNGKTAILKAYQESSRKRYARPPKIIDYIPLQPGKS